MKQAVILAAGEGKRLRPFTVSKPKVMLSVAGKPILSYIVDALVQYGIRNIILVVGYRKEQVLDYFGSGEEFGAEITYVSQDRQLGTAHALLQAKAVVGDEFLVLPGDNLVSAETLAQFVTIEPTAVLVKKTDNPSRYGVVTVEDGLIKEIVEKPKEAKSKTVSTGIYAFSRDVFDFMLKELDIPHALNNMIEEGYKLKSLETQATWLDAVYPWDLLHLNDSALRSLTGEVSGTLGRNITIKPPVFIGKKTQVRDNSHLVGPLIIGDNCEIGPFVSIMPSTSIGDNVVIEPFCQVTNSLISRDVHIGPGCLIQDSVIDKGCNIKGRFTALSGAAEVKVDDEYHQVDIGAMIGENCNITAGVTAQPGVIVGNLCQILSPKVISGRLPEESRVI